MSARHPQTWVHVNAQVDEAVAEVVSTLNELPGLMTVQSCQGGDGKPAYIYFYFGDWEQVCRFVFTKLGPAVREAAGEEPMISVEVFNDSPPMAKLTFDPEATSSIASGVRRAVYERP